MSTEKDFDPQAAVDHYRHAVAQLDAQSTDLGREEWRTIAARLCSRWTAWQGEDSLHEMAYGEP